MKDYVGSALVIAFNHFYYVDKSNAEINMSKVRFRPLTQELAKGLDQYYNGDIGPHVREVLESPSSNL